MVAQCAGKAEMATVPANVVLHMVDGRRVLFPVLVLQRPGGTGDDARGQLACIFVTVLGLWAGLVTTQSGLKTHFSNWSLNGNRQPGDN